MARQESDREDLLRDATAMVERIELLLPATADEPDQHIVVGFRRDGSASVYFGADPVYHFNSVGQLRRAFVSDELFKADRGRLVAMRRVRAASQVQLESRQLDDEAQARFVAEVRDRCEELRRAVTDRRFQIVGQVPTDGDVLGRVARWLEELHEVVIARSPHAR